jgi:pimeloyl-ACP methyl ester carboxylesterase
MIKGRLLKMGLKTAAAIGVTAYKARQNDRQALTEAARNYWHTYYDRNTVLRSSELRQEFYINSTGVQIHLDVYERPEMNAPVVIFNHGGAGYGRLFTEVALMFYDLGYTVVLPDQRGQGFSGGARGDYTIAEITQNVVDTVKWAKQRYDTPIFMVGGSVGGALTYYGAAAGGEVEAIACLNLFDFGNGRDGLAISRLAFLSRYPAALNAIQVAMSAGQIAGRLRLPFNWFGVFEKLMDERDAVFQRKWDADPIPPRYVSLRSLHSNLTTPPAVPFEHNNVPVLVINQALDKMVDPAVTRRNYERLGGKKHYVEVPFGHWSSQKAFWQTLVRECDSWFKAHLPARADQFVLAGSSRL